MSGQDTRLPVQNDRSDQIVRRVLERSTCKEAASVRDSVLQDATEGGPLFRLLFRQESGEDGIVGEQG